MACPATLNKSGRGEDGKYFSLWEPDVRLDQQYLWRFGYTHYCMLRAIANMQTSVCWMINRHSIAAQAVTTVTQCCAAHAALSALRLCSARMAIAHGVLISGMRRSV